RHRAAGDGQPTRNPARRQPAGDADHSNKLRHGPRDRCRSERIELVRFAAQRRMASRSRPAIREVLTLKVGLWPCLGVEALDPDIAEGDLVAVVLEGDVPRGFLCEARPGGELAGGEAL